MANEKSKAEQYRDERKARIAKAAKKNAHNMEKQSVAKKVIGKVISVIIIIAIVLTLGGACLNYYGVPQRLIPAGVVGTTGMNISDAEYEFYYMRAYNSLMQQAQQYSQYGMDYGYDTSLAPEDQTQTTKDENGKEITWVEYLDKQTRSMIQMYKAYAKMAEDKGYKLSDADMDSIDKQISDLKEEASKYGANDDTSVGYSLNAYLRRIYGGSVNKSFLKKQLELQTLAQKYYTERMKELNKSYDQKSIDDIYNKDKDSYDMVTFRIYEFTNDKAQSEDASEADKTKAETAVKTDSSAFYNAVTDEKSFIAQAKAAHDKTKAEDDTTEYDADAQTIKKNQLKSGDGTQQNPGVTGSYTEDVAKWLFDSSRKAGDKVILENKESGSYYVIYLVKAKAQADTINVRHILFMTVDQSTGEALSDADKAKAKKNAEDALKKWQSGDKTAESFGKLAEELTEDPGSKTNGGLYENAVQGQFETTFDNWCFDANRKVGDVEIIETTYGYHVMYFEGKGTKYYDSAIRSTKASEDFEKESEEALKSDTYEIGLGPKRLAYASKRVNKKIKGLVELQNANSAAQSSASNYSY